MTRVEVIGFVTNTPGIVVKYPGLTKYIIASQSTFLHDVSLFEWATISVNGVLGEWKKFEKEVVE